MFLVLLRKSFKIQPLVILHTVGSTFVTAFQRELKQNCLSQNFFLSIFFQIFLQYCFNLFLGFFDRHFMIFFGLNN